MDLIAADNSLIGNELDSPVAAADNSLIGNELDGSAEEQTQTGDCNENFIMVHNIDEAKKKRRQCWQYQ